MSDNSIDIPILKGNDSLSKKQPSLPYFQATSKSNSSQNEKWRKTFNISFIFCIIITVIFLIPLIHKKESCKFMLKFNLILLIKLFKEKNF